MTRIKQNAQGCTVGIISDTHGLLRTGVREAFDGADVIIHAGDIGDPGIIQDLELIAPVTAVRGNMDNGNWAYGLPASHLMAVCETSLYIIHDLSGADLVPSSSGVRVVINGHTHRPLIRKDNGILFINPGSAGPLRSSRPATVALLKIHGKQLKTRLLRVR